MTFLHARVRNYKPYIICSGFMFFISLLLCGAFGACGDVFAENLDYNVSIQPSLAVTIPSNTVSLNLNPFTTPFNTASLPVTVSTNNPTGFNLTMSSTDTNLTLRSGSETIPTLATNTDGYSESDFTTNAWGYKLSTATNYSPFALSNQLLVTDAPTNATTSTVTFAAKADSTKPAGTYELAIDFTAVANPLPTPTMQNLDPSLCVTDAPITVVDSRDNQKYKVQRLADGKCWLLDNLRLDLTNETIINELSSANTNIDPDDETNILTSLKSGNRAAGSRYATAGLTRTNWSDSEYSYSAPLVNVGGSVTSGDNMNTWTGDYTPDTVAPVTYGLGSGKIGAYYNYCAASAGSYCYGNGNNASSSSGDVTSDICPAGWKMPSGEMLYSESMTGDYYSLANAITGKTDELSGEDATRFLEALSLPLSGSYSVDEVEPGEVTYIGPSGQGSAGYFWSSSYCTFTPGSACSLQISGSSVQMVLGMMAHNGVPVRCIRKN